MFYVKDERVPQLTECEINNEQGKTDMVLNIGMF